MLVARVLLRCSKRNAVTKSEGRWFSLYVLGIKCSEKTIRTIETFKTIKMAADNAVMPDLAMILMVPMVLKKIKTIETFETFKTIKMAADNAVMPDLVMVLMVLMVLTVLKKSHNPICCQSGANLPPIKRLPRMGHT